MIIKRKCLSFRVIFSILRQVWSKASKHIWLTYMTDYVIAFYSKIANIIISSSRVMSVITNYLRLVFLFNCMSYVQPSTILLIFVNSDQCCHFICN